MLNKIFVIIFSFFIIQAGYCFSSDFEIVDLGLQESDESNAYAIDANGSIYGTFKLAGKDYNFFWNDTQGLTTQEKSILSTVEDTGITIPKDSEQCKYTASMKLVKMNSIGQMIYEFYIQERQELKQNQHHTQTITHKTFFKNVDGSLIDLGSLGGIMTQGRDLNDFGQVVGNAVTSEGKVHAFLWENGTIIDLGVMIGDLGIEADYSTVTAINNKGQILGMSTYALVHKGKVARKIVRAFLWENGQMNQLLPEEYIGSDLRGIGLTDSGIIFFEPEDHQCFAYDIESNNKTNLIARPTKIKGNKVYDQYNTLTDYSSKKAVKIGCPMAILIDKPEYKKYWSKIEREIIDFNTNGQVLIRGTNIYGEKHVILLQPVKVK